MGQPAVAVDGPGIVTTPTCTADSISPAQRELLHRLCELTAMALGAKQSYVLLWSPEHATFIAVAQHVDGQAGTSHIAAPRFSPATSAELLAQLRGNPMLSKRSSRNSGSSPDLYMALESKDGLLGIQVASGYDGDGNAAAVVAARLAAVTSLALEGAVALAESERRNAIKSDVLAASAHELRDAMQTMVIYQALLLADEDLSEKHSHQVRRMAQGVRQLLDLVERLIELARTEVSHFPIEVEQVSVSDLVAEVVGDIASQPESNPNLELGWEIADNVPLVRTDRVKLRIVLKNLLRNALKFTEAGTIRVRAYPHESGIAIDVSDSGAGIDAATRLVMFEPFRRGDGAAGPGSGLGLYIVRRFLEMLGGRIDIESEVQRGTTVRVWLPCDVPPPLSARQGDGR